ncbi:MAG: hypothetical protein LBO69_08735 [Ignavibacteria bacterium]|jgi:hypothetical protein|nr:hypothetical protein [Ignavibacteria bacterium]
MSNKKGIAIKLLIALTFISATATLSAQTKDWGIEWGGSIRTDLYWDTRATTGARESSLLFLPNNEQLNSKGNDINDVANFYWGSMNSRLSGKIYAPNCLGAAISGFIEMEFLGQIDAQTNMIRLRHAYADLDWGNSKLTIGQTWNPMYVPDAIPTTVSLNVGAPLGPLARNPQVRFSQNLGSGWGLQLTAFTERDMVSPGPNGNAVSYQRNALLPAFNLLFDKKYVSKDGYQFHIGIDGEFKTIKPLNFGADGEEIDATLNSWAANFFCALTTSKFTAKLNAIYGGNLADFLMLGGYAVSEYENGNPSAYTPFNNLGATLDLGYAINKNAKFGIMFGYNQNLGTTDEIAVGNPTYTAWGVLMDNMLRIAPRFTYTTGRITFGGEVEYTAASYGNEIETTSNGTLWKGKWDSTTDVSNIRILLSTTLAF